MKDEYTILVVNVYDADVLQIKKRMDEEYNPIYEMDSTKAIEIIKKDAINIDLVLLGLNHNVDAGMNFLVDFNKLGYSEKIPVLSIVSEDDEDIYDKMFEQKVYGFIVEPFNEREVFNRIKSALSIKRRYINGLFDSLNMLEKVFHRILKINMTNNTFKIVRDDENIFGKYIDSNDIAEISKKFTSGITVFEDDKEGFIDFINSERIRSNIKEGKKLLKHKYRRLVNNEYRWVEIEIMPAVDYTSEDEILVIYVRDIHDDYIKQIEHMRNTNEKAFQVIYVDLTNDKCITGSFENRVKMASSSVPMEDKDEFIRTFSRENLLKEFDKGNKSVSMYHMFEKKDGMVLYLKTCVDMVQSPNGNNIDGVLSVYDVTDTMMDEKLLGMLYEKDYQSIGLIDLKKENVLIKKSLREYNYKKICEDGKTVKYNEIIDAFVDGHLSEKEKKDFIGATSLEKIQEELQYNDTYEFNVYSIDDSGEKNLKKFKFSYFFKKYGIVLSTIEDVTRLVEQDIITSGLNRHGFIHKVGEKMSVDDGIMYAMIYFNIKSFKAVNEIFGTEGGDAVLRFVYNKLQNSRLYPEMLGRIDADHFVMLVKNENIDYDEITSLCRIIYKQYDKTINLQLRCGIYFIKERNKKVTSMCDRAKLANEYIKDDFLKPYAVYESSMRDSYLDRNEVINEVNTAMEHGEFKVFYQPIYDAKTKKIASAEALIRWEHPRRGIVSPGLFVPVLEENGSISEIDLFVAKTVNKFLQQRLARNKFIVPVSVNLSWMDFYNDSMMCSILTDANNTIINKGYQRYEVTETSYATLTEDNTGILSDLKKSGAKILLDDFGSGYSSFSTIRDYDFDILKIDMGFVKKIHVSEKAGSIIHSIIDMAHHMNAKVIAEGAETREQVDFLERHNCDFIQGFYFSKPLPQSEFEKLLDNEAV